MKTLIKTTHADKLLGVRKGTVLREVREGRITGYWKPGRKYPEVALEDLGELQEKWAAPEDRPTAGKNR